MSESNLYNDKHEYEDQERQPRRRRKKRGGIGGTFLKILGTLLLIGICTGAMLCCFAAVYIKTVILPEAALDLGTIDVNENSIMYYQDKSTGQYKELVTLLTAEDTIWVEYDEIPDYMKDAAVAIEDQRFWSHSGVDWKRTAKAILLMFTGQDIQGGSTITQQLIKNITTYDDVTVKRKVIEIFRALEFDKTYGKETTLEWYLNYIYLGSGCRGVGAAAYEYFGKSVSELSLAECASLISITNNPSIYGPYSDLVMDKKLKNGEVEKWTAKQFNKYRQENVLYAMKEQELISQREYEQAIAEELVFVRGEGESDTTTVYSWYEEQVRSDVLNDLMEQCGYSEDVAARMLSTGGLRIYTCLDPTVQAQVEKIYENENNLNYYSSNGEHLQSAITVIDNATGDLVGIAGSLGKKTGNLWYNMASEAKRQPGSSIKPIAVYAPAVDQGLITPITVVDDYAHHLEGGRAWPVNVDHVYRGLVTVREALANSYNTVSVRTLADLLTPAKGFEYARDKFHLSTLVEARKVGNEIKSDIDTAPLATGGLTDGTNTKDMAAAFAVFPNNGIYRNPRTYTRVEDADGNVILENESRQEIAVKDTTAYYMNSMLRSVVTSGGGTAANFDSGMAIAGKTGTTDSKHDRWFVGYTPYYTAAVWVGYKIPERVNVSGNPALNMWKLVMSDLHSGLSDKQFSTPTGLKEVTVCKDSGLRATEYCKLDARGGSRLITDKVFEGDVPTEFCTVHTQMSTMKICLDDPILDAEGKETGKYHLAGEYCPEESVKEICLLDYNRESVGGATAKDNAYLFTGTEGMETCTVHTGMINPFDPETWPFWPWGGEGDENGEQPQQPGSTDQPGSAEQPGPNDQPTQPKPSTPPEQPTNPQPSGGQDTPAEEDDIYDPNINPATGLPYGL